MKKLIIEVLDKVPMVCEVCQRNTYKLAGHTASHLVKVMRCESCGTCYLVNNTKTIRRK